MTSTKEPLKMKLDSQLIMNSNGRICDKLNHALWKFSSRADKKQKTKTESSHSLTIFYLVMKLFQYDL